jgi:hypothetical protein
MQPFASWKASTYISLKNKCEPPSNGHITPAKNAERILQGVPGWEPIADVSGAGLDSVNAGGAGTKAKPGTKK